MVGEALRILGPAWREFGYAPYPLELLLQAWDKNRLSRDAVAVIG